MRKTVLIIGSILFAFLFSCKSNQEEKKISKHESIINSVLGTQLKLPTDNDLIVYDYLNNYESDSVTIVNSKFKIYSRINASCSTCVNHIDQWNDLSKEFKIYNTSIILICYSEDDFEFIKYLCESGQIKKFQYPLFFDQKDKFLRLNTFMGKHKHFETVLTDKYNNIIAVGNPVISKDIGDIYVKEIQKSLK